MEAEAEAREQGDLVVVERLFDPELGAVVTVFEPADRPGERIERNEASAAEARRWSTVMPHNAVAKQTQVGQYGTTWLEAPAPQTVTADFDYLTDNGQSYFCLDAGYAHLDGEARLCRNPAADAVTCPIPDTQQPLNISAECLPLPFGTPSVFTGYPTTDDGLVANLYFWIHDMSVFAHDSWTAYLPWTNPLPITIVRNGGNQTICSARQACVAVLPSSLSIVFGPQLQRNRQVIAHEYGHVVHDLLGYNGGAAFPGRSVVEGFAEHNVVRYGHFRTRIPRSFDVVPATSYCDDYLQGAAWDSRLATPSCPNSSPVRWLNGEAIPQPLDATRIPDYALYAPWDTSTPCGRQNQPPPSCSTNTDCPFPQPCVAGTCCATATCGGGPASDEYPCGSVMATVFWTLSMNVIRVPFNDIAAGQLIIDVSQTYQPANLANLAFTYAISGLPVGVLKKPRLFAEVIARASTAEFGGVRNLDRCAPDRYFNKRKKTGGSAQGRPTNR